MTALQAIAAISAIAMMLAAPFVLFALASRSPVIDATDCAGADEGGVVR